MRLVGGAGAYTAAAKYGAISLSTLGIAGCQVRRSPQELLQQLVFAITSDVRSFDPAYIIMALDSYISANIHETLTWFNRDVELVPRLALSWEPEDQGLRWVFRLRPDVRFHDGTVFNAEAVKHHFDRIKNPETRSNRISRVAPLKSVEVLDPLTVRFHMHEPFAVWPDQIRSGWAGIVSPSRVAATSRPQDYTDLPVGTGPFRFVEYIPDRFIRLEKNPDHWNADAFSIHSLEFRPVREATTRLILVEQGRVDIAQVSFAHVDVAERSESMTLKRRPHLATSYVGFNNMRAPMIDVRVRRAINKAVDREVIVRQALRGSGFPAAGPVPRALKEANPELAEGYEYNIDLARKEMAEAGVQPGTRLILWSTERSEERLQCELLKEMLREIGLNIEPRIIDQSAYWGQFDRYQKRDSAGNPDWRPNDPGVFDMFIAGWVGGESAWGFLDPLFRSTSTSNSSFYNNPEVDRLLKLALATPDPEPRTQIFHRIQKIVFEDAPWLFMYDRELTFVAHNRIDGFVPHPSGEYEFHDVALRTMEGLL
jgi:ABC-type transport system substrate-binding protein